MHQCAQKSQDAPPVFLEVSLNSLKIISLLTFSGISPRTIITKPTSKVEHVDAGKLRTPSQHILNQRGVAAFYSILDKN